MLYITIPWLSKNNSKCGKRMQIMRPLIFFPFLMVCVMQIGCHNRGPDIRGEVVTSDDLAQSSMSPVIEADIRNAPVQGATVYLSLDGQQRHKIKNTVTSSDVNGRYSIATDKLPAPEEEGGYYYLVVEKEGFEPFIYRVLIGRYARYMENTVFLKRNP